MADRKHKSLLQTLEHRVLLIFHPRKGCGTRAAKERWRTQSLFPSVDGGQSHMHCVTLADLAATLSQHGPALLELRPQVPSRVIMNYWTASRSRQELWHRAMGRYRDASSSGNFRHVRDWWTDHIVMLEEIIVSELLTRVIAAIGAETAQLNSSDSPDASELNDNHQSLSAVTHGVFLSQLDASNRVGTLLLEAKGARVQDLVRLNRLRFGIDRWTDWLIGRVSVNLNRSFEYCIDKERAQAFCEEVREIGTNTQEHSSTWLMNAAMRDMLVRRTSDTAALPNANHQVAAAALALFRPELFDKQGTPKSMWLRTLQRNADKLKPFDFTSTTST